MRKMSKARNIAGWVLTALLSILFLVSAAFKFSAPPPSRCRNGASVIT